MEFNKKKINRTALICAATGGHINIVQELLKQQYIDTNIKDIFYLNLFITLILKFSWY